MFEMTELTVDARLARSVTGTLIPPGDKSVTHRALFFGALNHGRTILLHPSPAADCRSTLDLLAALGYDIRRHSDRWELHGRDDRHHAGTLLLDCGNSGTTVRLAMGFLTGERGTFTLTGDASLRRRPMNRVLKPLSRLGAYVDSIDDHLPVTIDSDANIQGSTSMVIDVASAQVDAALVLAGLRSREGVRLRRIAPMRDHTRRMLRRFGSEMLQEEALGEDEAIDLIRPARIERDITVAVPGDLSSAAFFIAAALLLPGSRLTIERVGLNPTRIAFLRSLQAMGGKIAWDVEREEFEPVGRIRVEHSEQLEGIDLSDHRGGDSIPIAEMIDELPLLMLIASQAVGRTTVRGAAELRVKESDRITATVDMLASLGVKIEELEDGFIVEGPQRIRGGVAVDHHGDHRLCMMAAVAALVAEHPVVIPHPEAAEVSYPDFWTDLASLTGALTPGDGKSS
jgi:3-phosphoshikimate 1-carboxyvinyltransferase